MKAKVPDERTWLKGLAVECPLGKSDSGCPLNGLRNLTAAQIRHIVAQMSDNQVRAVINYHERCLKERTVEVQRITTVQRTAAV
jgi:hypothetical protein